MAEHFVELDRCGSRLEATANEPGSTSTSITLCYETLGDPTDPTLFLIMGLGCQLIDWPDGFCRLLVDRGFHVVRYDNRDVGLSTHLPEPADVLSVLQSIDGGQAPQVPYLLTDMADDAIGLLDHLDIDRAHVVGASLGGMIAQTLAVARRDRLASLTSIMSTPGPNAAHPTPEALNALLSPPAQTVEEAQVRSVDKAGIWGSPGLYDPDEIHDRVRRAWARRYDPQGTARQFAAVLASGDRSPALRELDLPTLVIHGTADTLIPPAGGEATAAAIPGATLLLVEGMGHDLPRPLWPQVGDAIVEHVTRYPVSA
ncbi:MAG: alpha/beta fold hydrolase [Acidimicrobiales bacterium]